MNKNLSSWAAVLQELFSSWDNTARVTVCIVWAVCVDMRSMGSMRSLRAFLKQI